MVVNFSIIGFADVAVSRFEKKGVIGFVCFDLCRLNLKKFTRIFIHRDGERGDWKSQRSFQGSITGRVESRIVTLAGGAPFIDWSELSDWAPKANAARWIEAIHTALLPVLDAPPLMALADWVALHKRVANEIQTTFAIDFTDELTFEQAMTPATIMQYNAKKTGEKYLINPNK